MTIICMHDNCDRGIYHPQPIFADNYNDLIDVMHEYAPGYFEKIQLYGVASGCGGKCNCKRPDRIDNSLEFADWLIAHENFMPKEIVIGGVNFIHPFEEVQLKIKLGGKCSIKRWGEG